MKIKTNIKAGYSELMAEQLRPLPDLRHDEPTPIQDRFFVKTGHTVAAILE